MISNIVDQFPRITSGFVVFLAVLMAMGLWTSCESQRTIVNALDEKEANEIFVFLSSKGIDVQKVASSGGGGPGGGGGLMFDIQVPAAQATEAMALLNQNGLPRRRGQTLLNLFQSGGLVPSELEEKIRYEAGLAETIATTIRKIDGILDADVQLSFPEEDALNPNAVKGEVRASVYVKHQGVLDDPNTHLITKIKRLVASSINELEFDNVTVISDKARFSDVTAASLRGDNIKERSFVKVWTIVLAKESVSRFRVVFFSMLSLLLLSLLSLAWILWKIYPALMATPSGMMSLMSIQPLAIAGAGGEKGERKKKADKDKETSDEEESAEEEPEEDEGDQPEVS